VSAVFSGSEAIRFGMKVVPMWNFSGKDCAVGCHRKTGSRYSGRIIPVFVAWQRIAYRERCTRLNRSRAKPVSTMLRFSILQKTVGCKIPTHSGSGSFLRDEGLWRAVVWQGAVRLRERRCLCEEGFRGMPFFR
jgi:hypothetical protein